jgi:hypothetical protein
MRLELKVEIVIYPWESNLPSFISILINTPKKNLPHLPSAFELSANAFQE